jgi:hypothetical protein
MSIDQSYDDAKKAAARTLPPPKRPYTDTIRPPTDLALAAREHHVRELDPVDHAPLLRALSTELSRPESAPALRTTAQCIFDLRFHDLIEMCTSAIGKNDKLKEVEPYDLATGISGWAIETLDKASKT